MRRQVRAQQRKQFREENAERKKSGSWKRRLQLKERKRRTFLTMRRSYFLLDPKEAKNMKKAGFLEGTRLTRAEISEK